MVLQNMSIRNPFNLRFGTIDRNQEIIYNCTEVVWKFLHGVAGHVGCWSVFN